MKFQFLIKVSSIPVWWIETCPRITALLTGEGVMFNFREASVALILKGHRRDPQASWPLGLKGQTPPKVKAPSVTISIDDSDSQVPFSTPPFYPDPDYPMDSYVN